MRRGRKSRRARLTRPSTCRWAFSWNSVEISNKVFWDNYSKPIFWSWEIETNSKYLDETTIDDESKIRLFGFFTISRPNETVCENKRVEIVGECPSFLHYFVGFRKIQIAKLYGIILKHIWTTRVQEKYFLRLIYTFRRKSWPRRLWKISSRSPRTCRFIGNFLNLFSRFIYSSLSTVFLIKCFQNAHFPEPSAECTCSPRKGPRNSDIRTTSICTSEYWFYKLNKLSDQKVI